MNSVNLVGRLAQDPKLIQVGSKDKVDFSIAVKTGNNTHFLNVVAWDSQATNTHKYVKKGDQVAVSGYLNTRSYEKNGVKVPVVEVVANRVEFLAKSSANQATSASSQKEDRPIGGFNDEIW